GLYVDRNVATNLVATVRDSVASGNNGLPGDNPGFTADHGAELNIENCLATNNGIGVVSYASSLVRVANTTVTDNVTGLFFENSSKLLTRGSNTVEGNTTDGTFTGTYAAK